LPTRPNLRLLDSGQRFLARLLADGMGQQQQDIVTDPNTPGTRPRSTA
jgi:hypothetical protein